MNLTNLVCNQLDVKKKNEDCRVVPPRNDGCFTLAPFLGHKLAVIARYEAIFNCLFFLKPRRTLVALIHLKPKDINPTQTQHLSQGR